MIFDISDVHIDMNASFIVQREQLLVFVIASITNAFEENLPIPGTDSMRHETFYRNLKDLSESITHLCEPPASSIEHIISAQRSLKLMDRMDKFIKDALGSPDIMQLTALDTCYDDMYLNQLLGNNWELDHGSGKYTYTG